MEVSSTLAAGRSRCGNVAAEGQPASAACHRHERRRQRCRRAARPAVSEVTDRAGSLENLDTSAGTSLRLLDPLWLSQSRNDS